MSSIDEKIANPALIQLVVVVAIEQPVGFPVRANAG